MLENKAKPLRTGGADGQCSVTEDLEKTFSSTGPYTLAPKPSDDKKEGETERNTNKKNKIST